MHHIRRLATPLIRRIMNLYLGDYELDTFTWVNAPGDARRQVPLIITLLLTSIPTLFYNIRSLILMLSILAVWQCSFLFISLTKVSHL